MERWLPIPGFEGLYDVSDLGRVRSWRHRGGAPANPPNIRKLVLSKGGYLFVGLYRDKSTKVWMAAVHRLVLFTFVGPCPAEMEGCHNNGNSIDNTLPNLRWDTVSANRLDAVKHETASYSRGALHIGSKLTEDDVRCIRAEPAFRGVNEMLALAFDVRRSQIGKIRRRTSWRHYVDPLGEAA